MKKMPNIFNNQVIVCRKYRWRGVSENKKNKCCYSEVSLEKGVFLYVRVRVNIGETLRPKNLFRLHNILRMLCKNSRDAAFEITHLWLIHPHASWQVHWVSLMFVLLGSGVFLANDPTTPVFLTGKW